MQKSRKLMPQIIIVMTFSERKWSFKKIFQFNRHQSGKTGYVKSIKFEKKS